MSDESVFLSLPSAGAIAQWFTEEHSAGRFQNPGGDATLLSDDPHCTVWLMAMVDHDDQEFYLLDIATTLDESTTHDLLFVTAGLNERLACEWRMKPTPAQPWGRDGLDWFADRIEFWEETLAASAPSTPAPETPGLTLDPEDEALIGEAFDSDPDVRRRRSDAAPETPATCPTCRGLDRYGRCPDCFSAVAAPESGDVL